MSGNTIPHPRRGLATEAKIERDLVNGPEAEALQEAIMKAVEDYSDFLERNGLIWEYGRDPTDPDFPRMKAQALIVTRDYGDAKGGV